MNNFSTPRAKSVVLCCLALSREIHEKMAYEDTAESSSQTTTAEVGLKLLTQGERIKGCARLRLNLLFTNALLNF